MKRDGTLVAWGSNSQGKTSVPAGLSGVTAIAAGQWHTVALKSDGTVVAWGAGKTSTGSVPEYGQSIVPEGLSGVTAIAARHSHNAALLGTAIFGPTVTARLTGNSLTLLWPDSATVYRVESASSLSPPIIWSDVAGSFQTDGGLIRVVLPISGGQKFYRLIKP
ncbi:MAG: RCC1 domain-containing protein [Verrucomicrobia bacterium]|nr:RCC1 domain-containing protein [Verrucomicrobiota bacterium]